MKNSLLVTLLLLACQLGKAQTKPMDAPDLDKIEIKEANSSSAKDYDKASPLDVSITEEKEVVPPVISGHKLLPGEFEPEYPGGIQEFYRYLSKNIKVPPSKYIKGKVFVKFVIDSDGHIVKAEVIYGQVTDKMTEEISRVLLASPIWKPGIQDNKAVRVQYTMPLNF